MIKYYEMADGLGYITEDGKTIPNDSNNRHYKAMMELVHSGDAEIINYIDTIDAFEECKNKLAAIRWEKENNGITIDSVEVQTDMVSKNEMAGYVTESIVNGLIEVHWKLKDGSFVTYPIAQFKKVYQVVAKYRNECFGVEKVKSDEITNADDPNTVDLDSNWPNTTYITS